ncbi:hypothetical protein G4D82_06925 [Flavobacterium sp. CYK-4]|uniref:DUF6265 family protein n=1 Tax=Flavobacterium lotistagni TaxID=2709660 RepID=UPI00140E4E45|nr:DUF6265 family protein [Flavobacterium lotistagni]NHM06949.1 hypothetical protein [Flavobacterium lotistagni]
MRKSILLLAAIALSVSCKKSGQENQLQAADWLIGTWENQDPQGKMIEIWSKANDSIYIGESYYIKAKDTLHSEQIQLVQNGELVQYIPTVKGQNNDQPVNFNLTSKTDKELVFENPKHDFPQKIVYKKITADSLVATISGTQQGKASSESYPMRKK